MIPLSSPILVIPVSLLTTHELSNLLRVLKQSGDYGNVARSKDRLTEFKCGKQMLGDPGVLGQPCLRKRQRFSGMPQFHTIHVETYCLQRPMEVNRKKRPNQSVAHYHITRRGRRVNRGSRSTFRRPGRASDTDGFPIGRERHSVFLAFDALQHPAEAGVLLQQEIFHVRILDVGTRQLCGE